MKRDYVDAGRVGRKCATQLGCSLRGLWQRSRRARNQWRLDLVLPFDKNAGVFEVYQILLALSGIYILESMHPEEMVNSSSRSAHRASRARCRRSSTRSLSSSLGRAARPAGGSASGGSRRRGRRAAC